MNNERTTDPKEVEYGIRTKGLFAFIPTLPWRACDDKEVVSVIASAASMQPQLISDDDKAYLNDIGDSKFFDIQAILCKVIPFIDTNPSKLMDLIEFLVDRGGQDLAANQPNSAFLKWCEANLSRADEVIRLACHGNATARAHLTFALQAKGDVNDAIACLERSSKEQAAGVLALSRMQLDDKQSTIALNKIISLANDADIETTCGATRAAYDIAEKHPSVDRGQLQDLLYKLFESDDAHVIYLAALLLHWHHKEMTNKEFELCYKKVLKVDPKHKGTINEINFALEKLLDNGKAYPASQILHHVIQASDGKIGGSTLNSFFRKPKNSYSKPLAQLATDWLQRGIFLPCKALEKAVLDFDRTEPTICMHDIPLPQSPNEQIFLCRKAIGYLFLHPMTAAAFPVAVFDRGHPDAKARAKELLFDPLLLNYGGALVNWLGTISKENENCRSSVEEVLKRAEKVWDGFKLALEVVELQPSERERDVVNFQQVEEAQYIGEEAKKHSIFSDIKNEHLLYGDRTAFSVIKNSGESERQIMPFARIEIEAEYPKGEFFDPVGLDIKLKGFRHERLVEK